MLDDRAKYQHRVRILSILKTKQCSVATLFLTGCDNSNASSCHDIAIRAPRELSEARSLLRAG